MTTPTVTDQRAEFIEGLLILVDLLELHHTPGQRAPYFVANPPTFAVFPADETEARWWLQRLTNTRLEVERGSKGYAVRVDGRIHAIPVTLYLRDEIALDTSTALPVQSWVHDAVTHAAVTS